MNLTVKKRWIRSWNCLCSTVWLSYLNWGESDDDFNSVAALINHWWIKVIRSNISDHQNNLITSPLCPTFPTKLTFKDFRFLMIQLRSSANSQSPLFNLEASLDLQILRSVRLCKNTSITWRLSLKKLTLWNWTFPLNFDYR